MNRVDLSRADLTRADLRNAHLVRSTLFRADLTNADLTNADLKGCLAQGAEFYGANLSLAILQSAHMQGANLTGANLSHANLIKAKLDGAYLTGANLFRTNLSGADLIGADLTDTELSTTQWASINEPAIDMGLLENDNTFSFELSEIEAALSRSNNVREAVAVYRSGVLCGYVVPNEGSEIDTDAVLLTTKESLPVYLVPDVIIVLDHMPTFKYGKIDRSALPEPASIQDAEPESSDSGRYYSNRIPPLQRGEVRLAMELPDGMAPQGMAEIFQALSVLADTAVVVGPRLRDRWFEPQTTNEGATVLVVTDPGDELPIAIRRTRYGSTFITDFVDPWMGYVAAAGVSSIGTAVGVHKVSKGGADVAKGEPQGNSHRLLSLLLTLARPAERELWLQRRVERQRALLSEQQAQTRIAEERGMKAGRRMAEHTAETLRIAAKSEAEIRENFNLAGGDGDTVGKIIPLFRHDITVTSLETHDDRSALPPSPEPA